MSWESAIIAIVWIAFAVYWLISAKKIKKNKKSTLWIKGIWIRILCIIVAFLVVRSVELRSLEKYTHYQFILPNPIISSIGVILAIAGMACAFWARITIGRNWGQPMTQKVSPELVTSGPYTYVRHPIYSGVIFALVGTVLVEGLIWLIPCIISFVYFFVSAKIEEKNLTATFPHEYPQYMKRTKMLIPFVV